MGSMSERISMVEKELQKYNLKKSNATSLSAISSNINDRISILSDVHSELVAISEELYYYDMVDYIGGIKIESLRLGQCTSLAKELENAKQRFVMDRDDKYKYLCEKLLKRVFWAGVLLSKDILKRLESSTEFHGFYQCCAEDVRQKLRRSYFKERKRSMGRIIKECSENLEKTYQLLILGEMTQYEKVFGEAPKSKYDGEEVKLEDLGGFDLYIYELFSLILSKKNEGVARLIVKSRSGEGCSLADKVFSKIFRAYLDSKSGAHSVGI